MKNYSRAYNRQQQKIKFVKRVKQWFCNASDKNGETEYYLNLTLKGLHHTFLKTTSRPCNCYLCTYEKYKRIPKHKIMKEYLD